MGQRATAELTSPSMPLALSLAQTLFAIALGTVTLIISGFAVYVISTVVWADRWVRRTK
ncbi:MAG: hypothetical protein NVSMB16_16630 [Acidimicrobiales bacterium]